jgi:ketosteroid isomerase-like protein
MNSYPITGSRLIQAALAQTAGTLTWKPAFADVSKAADLGYTYGLATFKASDKAAEQSNYLRVWRKQSDGKWKVVLDIFTPAQ